MEDLVLMWSVATLEPWWELVQSSVGAEEEEEEERVQGERFKVEDREKYVTMPQFMFKERRLFKHSHITAISSHGKHSSDFTGSGEMFLSKDDRKSLLLRNSAPVTMTCPSRAWKQTWLCNWLIIWNSICWQLILLSISVNNNFCLTNCWLFLLITFT